MRLVNAYIPIYSWEFMAIVVTVSTLLAVFKLRFLLLAHLFDCQVK